MLRRNYTREFLEDERRDEFRGEGMRSSFYGFIFRLLSCLLPFLPPRTGVERIACRFACYEKYIPHVNARYVLQVVKYSEPR